MRSYEQAMESLRVSDPEFHQKLSDTLKHIVDLPEETVQQLADSLDHIPDSSSYREKLTSGLDDIRTAAEESWQAFEDEESWIKQRLYGSRKAICAAAHGTRDLAARSYYEVHISLNQQGSPLSNAINFGFLAICFCFATYLFYTKNSSRNSDFFSSRLTTIALFFATFVGIWVMLLGANDQTIRYIFPIMTLGALAVKLQSLIPPSRLWPERAHGSDAPRTWLGALGRIFGFLLSSGFFAWVVLMLQANSKENEMS